MLQILDSRFQIQIGDSDKAGMLIAIDGSARRCKRNEHAKSASPTEINGLASFGGMTGQLNPGFCRCGATAFQADSGFSLLRRRKCTVVHQRQHGDYDFMIERVARPPEPASVGCSYHPNPAGWHVQDFRNRSMHIMRRLRAGPERQPAVGGCMGDRGVLVFETEYGRVGLAI